MQSVGASQNFNVVAMVVTPVHLQDNISGIGSPLGNPFLRAKRWRGDEQDIVAKLRKQ